MGRPADTPRCTGRRERAEGVAVRLTRRRGNDGGAADEGRDDDRNGRGGRSRARRRRGEVPTEVDVEEIDEPMVPAREFGPYDLSEAPPDERGLLDLGALQVPGGGRGGGPAAGRSGGRVQQVVLAHGAAGCSWACSPRRGRRASGTRSARDRCATCCRPTARAPKEVEGEYGPELTARVSDGSTTVDVRHVGIDGPRWFVHGVYIGSAAQDPTRAGPLRDVLHGLVVDRGKEAKPVQRGAAVAAARRGGGAARGGAGARGEPGDVNVATLPERDQARTVEAR